MQSAVPSMPCVEAWQMKSAHAPLNRHDSGLFFLTPIYTSLIKINARLRVYKRSRVTTLDYPW